ncbi:MAG: MBL fold metallo-hydrolase [Gammaproteobacteria bacterium]|nr:MBL fold metallo-hydrolase [Gammaproteobacteria bacterium]
MPSITKQLKYNITQVDTGYLRPGLAACYLLIDHDRVAIIDTGVEHTVPRIQQVLKEQGLSDDNVDYVVPTHVHLDHAGGAGKLMAVCQNAQLVIHPFGSRHMIDPSKLIAGAQAVYGVQGLRDSVGEIFPVDAERVIVAEDLFRFTVGTRELQIVDTPGHARHHFCVWDEMSKGFFTGDTFGIAYPELDVEERSFIFPPSTPVQFDPTAWHASIDRLMAWHPERMYLTHFGQLDNPVLYMNTLHRMIDDLASLALESAHSGDSLGAAVEQYILQQLSEHGCQLDEERVKQLLDLDLDIIVQGLKVWISRQN